MKIGDEVLGYKIVNIVDKDHTIIFEQTDDDLSMYVIIDKLLLTFEMCCTDRGLKTQQEIWDTNPRSCRIEYDTLIEWSNWINQHKKELNDRGKI